MSNQKALLTQLGYGAFGGQEGRGSFNMAELRNLMPLNVPSSQHHQESTESALHGTHPKGGGLFNVVQRSQPLKSGRPGFKS